MFELDGSEVGIAGLKGFVGGFPGSSLPDFGEPLLREVYRQTSDDVAALDEGLRAIAHCPYRIVLMHYSPCADTLRGEPEGIWAFLGNERIAAPIREHEPDLVLHGHAHAGTFEGRIGASPVYNVSVPVMGRDFWLLELASLRTPDDADPLVRAGVEGHPAVDEQRRAHDVARLLGRQPSDRARDLDRLRPAPERDLLRRNGVLCHLPR